MKGIGQIKNIFDTYVNKLHVISVFFVIIFLFGCKPDSIELNLYTSDVLSSHQEIIEVPIKISFSLLGDDKQGNLPKAIEVAKKYLSPESTFSQSKSQFGNTLVIETKIPMGLKENLGNFLVKNKRIAVLLIQKNQSYMYGNLKEHSEVQLIETTTLDFLNKELQGINMMLGANFPAKKTNFKILSDSKGLVQAVGLSVFVSQKPYLIFEKLLKRRDAIEFEFNGKEGSVYNELQPFVLLKF